MQNILVSLFILTLVLTMGVMGASKAAFAADIVLPAPERSGGPTVLEAISNRSSARQVAFIDKDIPQNDLATLLWAGTGLNRENGWTVPMAMGSAPYVDIYVLLKTGVYTYDWQTPHRLRQINSNNIISQATSQGFVATASCVLVFVTREGSVGTDSWADVGAGAIAQNIYLASEALGIKVRYAASMNRDALLNNFGPSDVPRRLIAIMSVGYQE